MASRISHPAVFVAAIVFFLLGALWYTVLFGHAWTTLTGLTTTSLGGMAMHFVASFLLGWVLAYVIGIALGDTNNPNPERYGILFGLFMGTGVFATMLLMEFIYEGRSLALWAIDAGYVVFGMAIMGYIIGAWRKRRSGRKLDKGRR